MKTGKFQIKKYFTAADSTKTISLTGFPVLLGAVPIL
jgi:hypothetical protein